MATAKKTSAPAGDTANEIILNKKLTLIIAVLALLLMGAVGGGTAWYFLSDKPIANGTAETEPPKPPVFSALEPFVVNLQPEMGEQYLQVAMTLQVPEQIHADRIKAYMPVIRSRLLVLLSNKRASELTKPDGKHKLAEEIIAMLNEPFTAGAQPLGVSSVFFTAFVIQ